MLFCLLLLVIMQLFSLCTVPILICSSLPFLPSSPPPPRQQPSTHSLLSRLLLQGNLPSSNRSNNQLTNRSSFTSCSPSSSITSHMRSYAPFINLIIFALGFGDVETKRRRRKEGHQKGQTGTRHTQK